MLKKIRSSKISTDGLFLNADAGFDTSSFRKFCFKNNIVPNIDINRRNGTEEEFIFDDLLYKCRFAVESWLDAFKVLLVRFETNKIHWKSLNILAFTAILIRQL